MSTPDSTAEPTPAASVNEDAPTPDGWRSSGVSGANLAGHRPQPGPDLTALRADLDRIDNAMHDLLIERAKIVEKVARTGKPAAFRPGREASIVRRLVGRHKGALPQASLFRIWRELLAATTAMQGGFSMTVCDHHPGATLTQLAREHFGALTPLRQHTDDDQALADVGNGIASIAVLPLPSSTDTWWVNLPRRDPRLHVIARLPFWRARPEGAPNAEALVVAAAPPDASGDDRTFVSLACDREINRGRLLADLTDADLTPGMLVLAKAPGSPTTHVLADVGGFIMDDDARLARLAGVVREPRILGSYALPFSDAA